MLQLPDLQRAFFEAITCAHGDGASARVLAGEIREHGVLDSVDRIGIYAQMYCARLVGALSEDYPRVAAVVGAADFADLAHRYVDEHPSTSPSLRWFGESFATFLEAQSEIQYPPFLPMLARLEWSRLEVFDARDAERLHLDDLRRLPPADWPTLWLEAVPAVSTLDVTWPVHRIWAEADPKAHWQPETSRLRIWRRADEVYQVPMDAVEQSAFDHVRCGTEFAALCAVLAASAPTDAVARTAGGLVLRWVEDGILKRPVTRA